MYGKAVVGGTKTSIFPALLEVKNDAVKLHAFLGVYDFPSKFVLSIERIKCDSISINHVISDYPDHITFSSQNIYERIQRTGLMSTIGNTSVYEPIKRDRNPLKAWFWSTVTLLSVVGASLPWEESGKGLIVLSYSILTSFNIVLLRSKELQKLILKPERRFSEVRGLVVAFALWFSAMSVLSMF